MTQLRQGSDTTSPGEITNDEVAKTQRRQAPYQRYLDAALGLRNHWYPAFFSRELADGHTRGELMLGERLFFKRVDAKVYAVEDRCLHRGVAFSARPECYSRNTTTCWYHGWTYDVRDGKLVQILTEVESNLIGRIALKTYPVEEANGIVFVFIGDIDPPPFADDLQAKFFDAGLAFEPLMRHKIDCDWRLGAENGFDSGHIYAHRHAHVFTQFNTVLPLAGYVQKKKGLVLYEGPGPKGVGAEGESTLIWVADVEGVPVCGAGVDPENPPSDELPAQVITIYMPCGLQVEDFPLPGMIHFEWFIPMDEDHHMYMSTEAMYVSSEEEAAQYHETYETMIGEYVWKVPGAQTDPVGDGPTWGFNNFDAYARAQMHHVYKNEDWWKRERLFRPDQFILQWRILVSKHARGVQQRGDWANTQGWSPTGDGYSPSRAPNHWGAPGVVAWPAPPSDEESR